MTQTSYGTPGYQNQPGSPEAPYTSPAPQQQPPVAPLPLYDLTSPAEPAGYQVPDAHRLPYGVNGQDKRGPAWYPAFASLMCVVGAFIFGVMGSGLSLAAIIPAIAAIVLGIQALRKASRSPRLRTTGKAQGMAWGGIAGGVIAIPIAIGMFVLTSWAEDAANYGYCEYLHGNDPYALERCLDEYGY